MPQYLGSTTNLAAGTTYTSRWIQADNSPTISGSVFADQAGTLFIEQSGDGVNADVSVSSSIVASTGASFNTVVILPFVRLRVTNTAGSPQTVFRLISKWGLRPGT